MIKKLSELTKVERHAYMLAMFFGSLIILVGIVMKIYDFTSSSYSFGTRKGAPYTDPPSFQTLNWWGTVFIGVVIIAVGSIFRFEPKRKKKK